MSITLMTQDVSINPYVSAETTDESQSTGLHPPESIAVAVFLGGPLAGAILAAVNHAKMRRYGQVASSLFLASVVVMTLVIVGHFVPLPPFSGILIALMIAMAAKKMATFSFGRTVETQKAEGIQPKSKWYGAILGIVVAVTQLAAVFMLYNYLGLLD